MVTARDILQRKGSQVHVAAPDLTVLEALARMAEHNVGALIVVQEEKLVGIFSERDYARKVVLKGRISRDTLVREIMTPDPVAIAPGTEIRECMRLMTERQIRHLPVIDSEVVAGVLSIGDVVKFIIEDQEDSIQNLTRYITGR